MVRALMWKRLCDHSRLSSIISAISSANNSTAATVSTRRRGNSRTSGVASRSIGTTVSSTW